LALRSKVELRQDPAIPTVAARVTVATSGGKTYELSQPAARGSDANPMSDKDLENKLRDAAANWNPYHDIPPLIDAIWSVERSDNIASLAALTVPRA
jgi:2-methylcitrate dehydratase PrpD